MALTLVIGNKNYSSWSLRAWLFLVESGLEFSEVRLPLFSSQWYETINQYSPAGSGSSPSRQGFSYMGQCSYL